MITSRNDPSGGVHCFVHSPLAYLCMREYIAAREIKKAHLYVIATSPRSATMLEQLAKCDCWESERILSRGNRKGVLGRFISALLLAVCALRMRLVLRKVGRQDEIVLCHLANPYSRLIASRWRQISPGTLITVVDDGTTTLVEHEVLRRDSVLSTNNAPRRARHLYSFLEERLFSSKCVFAEDIRYFSMWDLSDDGLPKVLSPKNDFANIRANFTSRPRRNAVHFIGQPFVRRGLLSAEEYGEILDGIRDSYTARDLEFFYFPHRNEDTSGYGDRFRMVRLDIPYELHLANSHEWPSVLAGFYSACIASSLAIFGDELDCELFWGYPPLAPYIATSAEIAKAFQGLADSNSKLIINADAPSDGSASPEGSRQCSTF